MMLCFVHATVINDNCFSYELYPLKNNVTQEDYNEWKKENMPPDDFIKRYCREFTEDDM